jgi:SAM-dependent methyltransferase
MEDFVETPCPVCLSTKVREAYRLCQAWVPFSPTSRPLAIGVCGVCGFVFQFSAYESAYDRFMDAVYHAYDAEDLFDFPRRSPENVRAAGMVAKYLKGKRVPDVLEIGSNKGDLLYLVKERVPRASILGVDPSRSSGEHVPTICDYFRPELFSSSFDAILLKQVLEHFKDPHAILKSVVALLKEDGILYLDVPNLRQIVSNRTDGFILEHVLYFTLETLDRVLPDMEMVTINEGASLCVVCRRGTTHKRHDVSGDALQLFKAIRAFAGMRRELKQALAAKASQGHPIVFYGCYNVFRMLFRELETLLMGRNCFYFDDVYFGATEPVFGLPRRRIFTDQDVIVLCSNNSQTLANMENNAVKLNGTVLRPWQYLGRPQEVGS